MPDEHFARVAPSGYRIFLAARDERFDQALKILRAAKRGANIAVANELTGEIGQQVFALITWQSQFSAVCLMSHASKILVVFVVEHIDGPIATLRRLQLKAVLLQLIANFDQRFLAETANAGEVGFG